MKNEQLLRQVSKPGRYIGGELGEIKKDPAKVSTTAAFCFPDTYEIGMSNLGMRILYHCINQEPDFWCQRVFAPWSDMEEQMRRNHLPLYALESGAPVNTFDFVMFTMQYELCYTNVLNMLQLSDIPLCAADRTENDPIVVGGGPCTYNPEPMAQFFDAFSIGEGEYALVNMMRLYADMKAAGTYTRNNFLRALSHLGGFYVPSLYTVDYHEDGTIAAFFPNFPDVPEKIKKQIVLDMDQSPFPVNYIKPYIETVHDRIVLEVYRGCPRGCRFCQAGMLYRPARNRSAKLLDEQARALYEATGFSEISMCSLSISDYTELTEMTNRLLTWTDDEKVSISLPSLRADTFTKELMDKISGVRSSTLTFAPEAGSQRLRDVINKNVTLEEILRACDTAFTAGKNQVKLYFMIGHPTETDEDLAQINEVAQQVIHTFYQNPNRNRARGVSVTLSVATFIPKPFTPFQWEKQDAIEETQRKQQFVKTCITDRKIRYHYHDAKAAVIEAVCARGDRRVGDVILRAFESGCKFDSWDECFDYDKWMAAFDAAGISPAFYTTRGFGETEILPWDMIDIGVDKSFLLRERHRAYAGQTTKNCMEQCSGCGASRLGGKMTWCPPCKTNNAAADRCNTTTEQPTTSAKITESFLGKSEQGAPHPDMKKIPAAADLKQPANITTTVGPTDATLVPNTATQKTTEKKATPCAQPGQPTQNQTLYPIRLCFYKRGALQFISHLDLTRTMTHALTRAGIPIQYSQGFNPHPKMVFSLPLPIGVESEREYLDCKLTEPMSPEEVMSRLNQKLPAGLLQITRVSTQQNKFTQIGYAGYAYHIWHPAACAELAQKIEERCRTEMIVTKRSKQGEKTLDIAPLMRATAVKYDETNNCLIIHTRLCANGAQYINPELLIRGIEHAFSLSFDDIYHSGYEILRRELYLEDGVTVFE